MAGRNPTWTDPDAMQQQIDQYFLSCQGKPLLDDEGQPMRDKYGEIILLSPKPPTITGLALALGFNSRQSLLNYQGKKAFMDTVTRAKARVEEYTEERLFDRDGQRGAQFSLEHNFKWRGDKAKEEESGSGVVMLTKVLPEPEPPEEAGT